MLLEVAFATVVFVMGDLLVLLVLLVWGWAFLAWFVSIVVTFGCVLMLCLIVGLSFCFSYFCC